MDSTTNDMDGPDDSMGDGPAPARPATEPRHIHYHFNIIGPDSAEANVILTSLQHAVGSGRRDTVTAAPTITSAAVSAPASGSVSAPVWGSAADTSAAHVLPSRFAGPSSSFAATFSAAHGSPHSSTPAPAAYQFGGSPFLAQQGSSAGQGSPSTSTHPPGQFQFGGSPFPAQQGSSFFADSTSSPMAGFGNASPVFNSTVPVAGMPNAASMQSVLTALAPRSRGRPTKAQAAMRERAASIAQMFASGLAMSSANAVPPGQGSSQMCKVCETQRPDHVLNSCGHSVCLQCINTWILPNEKCICSVPCKAVNITRLRL